MRTFWALVAIIVFAAAAMWFTTAGAASHQAQSRARDEQQKSQQIAQELMSREQAARQQAASATPASDPAPPSDPAPTDAIPPSPAETPAAPPPLTGKAEDTSETASAHTDPDTPLASTSAVESPRPEPLPEPSPDPAPATSREPDPSAAPVPPAESKPAETGPIPAKIERLDNGNLKVDGRFTVKGDGSQENPYEVSWDHLISVSELYNPRDGKKRLPERVTMLDGKFVRLTGYVAFPMYVDKPRELLSMLNQWDGCCIGVPPTPFDAVEVRLKAAVEGSDRYATQGEVTGKFGVKPYLAGDWLVGLFVMDDAQFTTRSTAGSTRN